ncbi:MAG: ferrous iron transporter B [Ruminococcaceae bacterium]|nr:ferrous iron transporter B [Oscillospiraceae bacterium]
MLFESDTLKQSKNLKKDREENEITVALLGNPNVGKSTLFNQLTGMKQHTGNWSGKTVEMAEGYCRYRDKKIRIIDLPGTYSLSPHSAEEAVTEEIISSGIADCTAIVCDAGCLERNLILVLQAMEMTDSVIVCLNLMDEAEKRGISIDTEKLGQLLGVPIVPMSAIKKKGVNEALKLFSERRGIKKRETLKDLALSIPQQAETIAKEVIKLPRESNDISGSSADRILCGKFTAFPIMLLLLAFIFWLTMVGANYPSALLSRLFLFIQNKLLLLMNSLGAPEWLCSLLVLGVWRTLSCVVAVMLPPMAIFFPLFTLLEDLGYLPRVAFNLDRCFKRCDACGKQALTMCMGFGCNAAGVVGCRIIDSKRERLIAMLTNVFVPCNGRFPTITALISVFIVSVGGLVGGILSALILALLILLGFLLTFIVSKLLSVTILRGEPSSFTLELPPYRRPQITKIILRSVIDRTFHVLMRAIVVAAPAGLVIWLLANLNIGDVTLLRYCTDLLDPFASVFGLDGVILLAFILALPANEIVIPIVLMSYSSSGILSDYSSLAELGQILRANGWTTLTAVCVILFMLCHFPCSTTLMTIKKESGKLSWALLAAIIPTAIGLLLCFIVSSVAKIF